jgi:hypothetical protein
MMPIVIKFFTVAFCAIYTFTKLLNVWKLSSKNIAADILTSICISFAAFYAGRISVVLILPVILIFLVIYTTLHIKIPFDLSITSVIISLGISYTTFFLAGLIISFLFALIRLDFSINNTFPMSVLGIVQLLLIGIPYRFKRLRKGMPFLINKGGTIVGVIISMALLFSILILFNKEQFLLLFLSFFIITSCAALIIYWWRSNIKRLYLKKVKDNEVRCLHESIKEKDDRIRYLEQQNSELSKVIHKDNKLIPAMELAVKEYLQQSDILDLKELQTKGYMLLSRLEKMSQERSGILNAYQSQSKQLPSTKVISIDALMAYMLKKAVIADTVFDLTVTGSIKYMAENIISETDLNTILADLIENALIAVGKSSVKKVLVSLGIVNDIYVISVYDSGEPFNVEVLSAFGNKKITTHAYEGGSGIGLMTLCDIASVYNASIVIDELIPRVSGYSKEISVRFDQLGQFTVNTPDIKKKELIKHNAICNHN